MRRRLARLLVLATVTAAVGSPLAYIVHQDLKSVNQVYELTELRKTVNEQMVEVFVSGPPILVRRVQHMADGAVCFVTVEQELFGCIKAENYYLHAKDIK